MFERAAMPVFSGADGPGPEAPPQGGAPSDQKVVAAIGKPHGPGFGGIPYPPNQDFGWHPVPACMFGMRWRVTSLYDRPVVELKGDMYRHPTLVAGRCPPGTENYTRPDFKLWAMVQTRTASAWSLRSEANYEQKLFNGQASPVGFIPFVGAPFDKAGGYLSYFVPQRGVQYEFMVWLRDATHGRDLSFLGPQGPSPMVFSVHVP